MNTRLAGLGAVAVLLGGYVAVQGLGFFQPTDSVQAPSSGATATRAAAVKLNPLDGLDPAAYADIVDKPLFNPSRRPRPAEPPAPPPPPEQPVVEPPPPPPPPAPAGPGPDDYKLLGVSAGPDGRIAALRIASSGAVVYLRQGESIDSWSVVEIGDRTVAIGTPESPVTFSLFATGGDGAAGGGQPSGGAQQQPLPLPLPLPLPMPKQQPAPQPGQPPLPEQFTLPDTGG